MIRGVRVDSQRFAEGVRLQVTEVDRALGERLQTGHDALAGEQLEHGWCGHTTLYEVALLGLDEVGHKHVPVSCVEHDVLADGG